MVIQALNDRNVGQRVDIGPMSLQATILTLLTTDSSLVFHSVLHSGIPIIGYMIIIRHIGSRT